MAHLLLHLGVTCFVLFVFDQQGGRLLRPQEKVFFIDRKGKSLTHHVRLQQTKASRPKDFLSPTSEAPVAYDRSCSLPAPAGQECRSSLVLLCLSAELQGGAQTWQFSMPTLQPKGLLVCFMTSDTNSEPQFPPSWRCCEDESR